MYQKISPEPPWMTSSEKKTKILTTALFPCDRVTFESQPRRTAFIRTSSNLPSGCINPALILSPLPLIHDLIYQSAFIPLTPSAFLSHPPLSCLSHTKQCVCMRAHARVSCTRRLMVPVVRGIQYKGILLLPLLFIPPSSSLPISQREDDLFLVPASPPPS